jgi:hypothetical protein
VHEDSAGWHGQGKRPRSGTLRQRGLEAGAGCLPRIEGHNRQLGCQRKPAEPNKANAGGGRPQESHTIQGRRTCQLPEKALCAFRALLDPGAENELPSQGFIKGGEHHLGVSGVYGKHGQEVLGRGYSRLAAHKDTQLGGAQGAREIPLQV